MSGRSVCWQEVMFSAPKRSADPKIWTATVTLKYKKYGGSHSGAQGGEGPSPTNRESGGKTWGLLSTICISYMTGPL